MSEKKEQGTNLPKYFLSGGFGGICTVVSGHPFDTIKVRLQTMPSPAPGQKPLYAGTFDCMKQTLVKEGPKGFYKGMSAPLVGVAPIFAISFFGYGIGKKLQQKDTSVPLDPHQLFLAGAFSGIFTTAIMAPGERIKCLLQVQQGGTQPQLYNGPVDCVKKLYKQGGLKSIYKGTCATLLRDVPASGMYFFSYELIQRALMKPGDDPNKLGIGRTILAGGCTGIAFWIVGMPADVLKSRLQTSPEGTYPRGVRDVFKQLIKQDGVTALYRGVIPVMMRAFPANAACFLGFEVAMNFLNYIF